MSTCVLSNTALPIGWRDSFANTSDLSLTHTHTHTLSLSHTHMHGHGHIQILTHFSHTNSLILFLSLTVDSLSANGEDIMMSLREYILQVKKCSVCVGWAVSNFSHSLSLAHKALGPIK